MLLYILQHIEIIAFIIMSPHQNAYANIYKLSHLKR